MRKHVQEVDNGQEADVDDGKEGKGADGGGVEERRLYGYLSQTGSDAPSVNFMRLTVNL